VKLTKKQTYALFLGEFVFTLILIVWTVIWASKADVYTDEENSFFQTYHELDFDYNKIVATNKFINKNYDIIIKINDYTQKGLDFDDIYLPKKIIENRKEKKDILNVGNNKFSITVKDKNGKSVDFNLKLNISKPTTNKAHINLTLNNESKISFKIPEKSYWNIMGEILIENKYKGYFLIKTNAK